jgi:hypothetical protein
MIRPGQEWGSPVAGPPDVEVEGGDDALARCVRAHPGARVRFRPHPASDVARAVGLDGRRAPEIELPMDALRLDDGTLAVNMAVVGAPPDRLRWWTPRRHLTVTVDGEVWFANRATTVVVAVGQFLRGRDVVPRGHPGDGRAEIQAYALAPGERAAMRARLRTGAHVPHPRVLQRAGRRVEIVAARPAPVEVDRSGAAARSSVAFEVVPAAYLLLV